MFKTVFFSGFVLIAVGQCFAGLDIDRLHDQTVAIYHFENNEDSGPRCLNLDFGDDTQITGAPESHLDIKIVKNGKIDKSVRLKGVGDIISYCEGLHFGLVDNEFSIVAWVNMPKQVNQFFIAMEAWGDDQTIHRVGKISLVVNNDGNL